MLYGEEEAARIANERRTEPEGRKLDEQPARRWDAPARLTARS